MGRLESVLHPMQKISILYDASQAVLSTFDLDEVLQQILAIARDYFHLQNVAIFLRDKDELYVRCQVGWDAGHDKVRLPIGTGITEAAAKTVVGVRMKRAGARFSQHGGQAVMIFRTALLSGRFDGLSDCLEESYKAVVKAA